MRRLIAFTGALAGALLLATLGLSSVTSRAAEGSQLVTLFTVDDLTEIAKQQGATEIQSSVEDGEPVISLKKDDLYFGFVLRGCQIALGCKALQLALYFEPGKTPFALADVNAMNIKYALVKFFVAKDGALAMSRFIIADGGISKDNIVANIAHFFAMPGTISADSNASGPVSWLRRASPAYAAGGRVESHGAVVGGVVRPVADLDVQKKVHAVPENPLYLLAR